MQIKDIQEEKIKLQNELFVSISKSISDFQMKTGCKIADITLEWDTVHYISDPRPELILMNVSVKVEI